MSSIVLKSNDASGRLLLLLVALGLFFNASICAADTPQVEFRGNVRYNSSKLQKTISEELAEYRGKGDISYIDDAAYKLRLFYRQQGHYFATVDYRVATKKILFVIDERQPILVKKVKIVAASGQSLSFPEVRLKKFITQPSLMSRVLFRQGPDRQRCRRHQQFLPGARLFAAKLSPTISFFS